MALSNLLDGGSSLWSDDIHQQRGSSVAKGRLGPAKKAEIMTWLNEKWVTQKHCPICSSNNWIISEHLVTPLTMTSSGVVELGGENYPHFMIVCGDCGYTHLFNAVISKLLPGNKEGQDGSGKT